MGMHRSGTSGVARALNLLGAYVGETGDLVEPSADNPEGYWERKDIILLHHRLFEAFSLYWDSAVSLPEQWYRSPEMVPFRAELASILDTAFAGRPFWMWKDPRSCILIDLWKDVLCEKEIDLTAVYVVRHPHDVARSLNKRDGFPLEKSYGLWFYYNISALRNIKDVPTIFLSYDRVLGDLVAEMRRCADFIDIPGFGKDERRLQELTRYVRKDLRHYASGVDNFDGLPGPTARLYQVLVDVLQQREPGANCNVALIDEMYREYRDYSDVFRADLQDLFQKNRKIHDLKFDIAALEQAVERRDAHIGELTAEVATSHNISDELSRRLYETHAELVEKRSALFDASTTLDRIYGSRGWKALNFYYDVRRFLSDRGYRRYVAAHATAGVTHAIPSHLGGISWIGLRLALREKIAGCFGMKRWPGGMPYVSQGFGGETLETPPANADAPLISVVMPVYNACRANKLHFLNALESIAGQTYRHLELVVVDDGSTDDSRAVLEEFLSSHPDLQARYFAKPNGGQSSARNFGVKFARGDYIGFIDQDDEWYRDKLERVVPWLANKDIDVLYTDGDTIDDEGRPLHGCIHQTLLAGWPHPKTHINDILFKDIFVMPGLMTIKKEIFEQVGGFDEHLSGYEDDDLFLRLFEKGRIFYLPEPTLRWRFYGDNYSFSHRMLASRSHYWNKLLQNYTDGGRDHYRREMISIRFFWEFVCRALDQYAAGNPLYEGSMASAREILPYLPKAQQYLLGRLFDLPIRRLVPAFELARKFLGVTQ